MTDYNDSQARITLFGGEPLLPTTKKSVSLLFQKLRQVKNVSCDIITNTTYFSLFKELFLKYADIVKSFHLTLLGPAELHNRLKRTNNFNHVIEAVQFIQKVLPETIIYINYFFEKRNQDSISDMFEELGGHGIDTDNIVLQLGRIQFRRLPFQTDFPYEIPYTEFCYPIIRLRKNNIDIFKKCVLGSEIVTLAQIYKAWQNNEIVAPGLAGCRAVDPGVYCFYPDGFIYPCSCGEYKKDIAIGSYHPELKIFPSRDKWKNHRPRTLGFEIRELSDGERKAKIVVFFDNFERDSVKDFFIQRKDD